MSHWDKAKCPKISHSMQPKRGLYLKVEHLELPIGHFDQQCCSARCQRHARVAASLLVEHIHYTVMYSKYCLKCPPNSTVALILACSMRQELAGHLGTHSAQCRKHITCGIPRQMLHTAMVSGELAMASAV